MEFFLVFVSCVDFTPEDSLKSIPVLLIEGDVVFRFVQDGFIGVLIDIPSGSFIIALQNRSDLLRICGSNARCFDQ